MKQQSYPDHTSDILLLYFNPDVKKLLIDDVSLRNLHKP